MQFFDMYFIYGVFQTLVLFLWLYFLVTCYKFICLLKSNPVSGFVSTSPVNATEFL